MIETDLFEFAYVPDWYGQLEQLAEMALPEAWRFRKPQTECKNTDTPILERYLHMMFRKLSIDYNTGETAYFHVENNCACFHTGLYTRQYQAIYACFERNKKKDTTLKWYFTGFCDAVSSKLRYVEPLPKKPYFPMMQNGVNFNPEWPIRVNAEHILSDPENRERLPKKLLRFKNLPLLLETAVELGRRKTVIEPGLVVPQGYQNQLQFLLPICLTNMEKPNLPLSELLHWAETELKPKAELAAKGEGDFCAGEHCRFCKVKATCRKRAEYNLQLAKYDFAMPDKLTDTEIETILATADQLTAWVADVKEYALRQALSGKQWHGYKVVAGKSNRKYTNPAAVAEAVQSYGKNPYKEPELLGVTAMEQLLGRTQFEALLGSLTEKPQGKPTLVPCSDKRPAWSNAQEDFNE